MRHITGDSRQQANLLTDTLDDYVDEDQPVLVIDAFVVTPDITDLDTGLQVAIDGSKYKAAASKDSVTRWRSCLNYGNVLII